MWYCTAPWRIVTGGWDIIIRKVKIKKSKNKIKSEAWETPDAMDELYALNKVKGLPYYLV